MKRAALTSLTLAILGFAAPGQAESYRVYAGTYTGVSKGIYQFELDSETAGAGEPALAAETVNPSFLALHPQGTHLYAVNEISNYRDEATGSVTAFAIDAATGSLIELNRKASGGAGPCHLTLDRQGTAVLIANYGGGSVSSIEINPTGELGDPVSVIQHHGSSVNPKRQQGPHAHGIYLNAPNRLAYVPDLGLDRVLLYRFDEATGRLSPNEPHWTDLKPGAGPRHLALSADDRFVYVINELDSTITVFEQPSAGRLVERQTVSTLPEAFDGNNSTAEIALHPGGKFLYGSNRGHNSIAVYAVNGETGKLQPVEHEPTRGETPRNFAITPDGKLLLAANQNSNTVEIFRIAPGNGSLEHAGVSVEIPRPVCLVFSPMR